MQSLTCDHDGALLTGQMAIPTGDGSKGDGSKGDGPFPAVLVMHSAYGLGDQVKKSAQALAALGYIAVATDMYGGGAFHDDPQAAGKSLMGLMETPGLLRARCAAWFDAVRALPGVDPDRVAAIGYCFGGQCVLELARSGADVKAVVSYHGLLTTAQPAEPGAVKGEVVAYCGAKDPFAPLEQVEALRAELAAAGVRHQITLFSEAAHAFTDPDAAKTARPGIEYHALSDRLSWAGTLALLDSLLTPKGK